MFSGLCYEKQWTIILRAVFGARSPNLAMSMATPRPCRSPAPALPPWDTLRTRSGTTHHQHAHRAANGASCSGTQSTDPIACTAPLWNPQSPWGNPACCRAGTHSSALRTCGLRWLDCRGQKATVTLVINTWIEQLPNPLRHNLTRSHIIRNLMKPVMYFQYFLLTFYQDFI